MEVFFFRRRFVFLLCTAQLVSLSGLILSNRPSPRLQPLCMLSDQRGSPSFKPRNAFAAVIISTGLMIGVNGANIEAANAVPLQIMKLPLRFLAMAAKDAKEMYSNKQSPGWEMARQKRTAAVKLMQDKGILQIDTDDAGNQFLKLPWIPDHKVKYKSLSLTQRLSNEVCAGAFGEFSKDVLLHAVDTAKTRKQAQKKAASSSGILEVVPPEFKATTVGSTLSDLKDMYAGFPVVLMSSIPQGGIFFFMKKGCMELLNTVAPALPNLISSTVPIGFGVMAYWLIRTPAEVIKTQVQTGQSPNFREAFANAKSNEKGLMSLWKYYPVMLSLDMPFQVINFILFGFVSDAVLHAGYDTSVWTRLFCGITCGMVSAALTCPIDVCKTRIVSRDRAAANEESEVQIVTGAPKLAVEETEDSLLLAQLLSQELDISDTLKAKRRTIMEEIKGYDRDRIDSMEGSTTVMLPLSAQEQLIKKADMISKLIISLEQKQEGKRIEIEKQVSVVYDVNFNPESVIDIESPVRDAKGNNVIQELFKILEEEGVGTLFLGIKQRLIYVGLANGIRLAAYGTSRMDLMMKSLDDL